LIQQAQARAQTLCSRRETYVLAVKDLKTPIKGQLKLSNEKIFVDPVRRGTWPTLLWAMAHLRRSNPEAVLAVLTGDQIIPRLAPFRRAARQACRLAQDHAAIVMLGVAPGSNAAAWTGFGVFRVDGHRVTAFSEKPSLAQAQAMLREGGWEWNSGMFFFRISTAEKALARFQPAMHAVYERLCDAISRRKISQARALYAEFPAKIPHPLEPTREVDNSIDFAIMMPLVGRCRLEAPGSRVSRAYSLEPRALAVTGGLPEWTDLGQWETLCERIRPDPRKNSCVGTVKKDAATQRCILAADRGFTLDVRGLTDAVVAVSERGLLVLPRRKLPRIKDYVARAPSKKFLIVNALSQVRIQRSGRRVVVSGAAFIG